ncbi:hypothetical protein Scep_022492 [Stephania cephalantha]|uniref:Peptidase S54 rhomboid domain-containing protein n=1 Tax=Stephania cephalantha TaxID=152367 RepID=A0AAP0FAK5_9MAGN
MHVAGKTRQGAEAYHRACKETCMPFPMKSEMHVKCSLQNEESQAKPNCGEDLKRENLSSVFSASGSKSNERLLRALDSYFHKLQNAIQLQGSSKPSKYYDTFSDSGKKKLEPSAMSPSKETENARFNAAKELSMLDSYLDKLNQDSIHNFRSTFGFKKNEEGKLNNPAKLAPQNDDNNSEDSQAVQPYDETSDTYLACVLAAINIAVFLFEIASPVKNSDVDLLTLPSLYGAKINQLIVVGEWWRLVTPMFLHYGILHVALSCWVLLNFGPQVCKGYGSCTFLLLYILGGISGNLISFIHTPDPTVGGTGPIFAIIGAWLIYQIQNKATIPQEASENMFWKAVIATALSFVIRHTWEQHVQALPMASSLAQHYNSTMHPQDLVRKRALRLLDAMPIVGSTDVELSSFVTGSCYFAMKWHVWLIMPPVFSSPYKRGVDTPSCLDILE